MVSDAGSEVEYWVQYGPTRAYGSESARGTVTAATNTLVSVSVELSGLAPVASYHTTASVPRTPRRRVDPGAERTGA